MARFSRLKPVAEERVAKLVEKSRGFKDAKGDEGVIKVDYAFAAFTNGWFSPF